MRLGLSCSSMRRSDCGLINSGVPLNRRSSVSQPFLQHIRVNPCLLNLISQTVSHVGSFSEKDLRFVGPSKTQHRASQLEPNSVCPVAEIQESREVADRDQAPDLRS